MTGIERRGRERERERERERWETEKRGSERESKLVVSV